MLGRFGRSSWEILTTGPTITNDQFGRICRDLVEQVGVEALVDHAVEAQPRPRQVFLVGGIERRARALAKCARSTDDGKQWTFVVAVLLRLEQARAAGEHDVGAGRSAPARTEQLAGANLNFESSSIASKTVTSGLICAREGQHHRRIIPGDQRTAQRSEMRVEQARQRRFARVFGHAFGQMRDDDADIGRIVGLADLQKGGFAWRRSRSALPNK